MFFHECLVRSSRSTFFVFKKMSWLYPNIGGQGPQYLKRIISVLRLNGVRKLFLGGQFWMFVRIQQKGQKPI